MSEAKSSSLYDRADERSSCGVGFITRKDGVQSHDVLVKGHEALCAVPHRGGMSAEGVGDGAGVSVDLSQSFFRRLTGRGDLQAGRFGVGNVFLPRDPAQHARAGRIIATALADEGMAILFLRDVPVDPSVLRPAAVPLQLPIRQWVFAAPEGCDGLPAFDRAIHRALLVIEADAYTDPALSGFYPLSFSARTQVLKGRLNSNEVMPYFQDLTDPDHAVHTLYFHTRFSTNTDPRTSMAQPFRLMAHNGELNTDKKNRLSEAAIARARNGRIVSPEGQSDSCRLDQTLQSRVMDDGQDLVAAVVSMMPPAWENDPTLSPDVRAMLEYFSLYEEKNDGPAALIFGDGEVVGARLDRLGLRPLRSVETAEYLCVMSEAGQIRFPAETVIRRGRIEAGGMLFWDHRSKRAYATVEALEMLAARRDYKALLADARVTLESLPDIPAEAQGSPLRYRGDLQRHQRYVAYAHNQESFKFLMDPMLQSGSEKISAMGYGNAINALSDQEGGVAKYFSQRFAQVTNPPLDSLREADGMTLRVALGAKPNIGAPSAPQIVVRSPILTHLEMLKIREQASTPVERFEMLYRPALEDGAANARAIEAAIDAVCGAVETFARERGGVAVLTDRHVARDRAALPLIIVISAVNQRLISEGLRLRVSLIAESGQIASSHHVATALGFGASAVYPLGVQFRAEEKFGADADKAFKRFAKAAEKALMKTMGKVGLCTAESYIGGEFFEPNFLDTNDPALRRWFPNVRTPVGGVTFAVIAQAAADWHAKALEVRREDDIPLLGLFKERAEGAGHSFGTAAVRGFVDMTEEPIAFQAPDAEEDADSLRLLPLTRLVDAFGLDEEAYKRTSFERRTPQEIDAFRITPGYRAFSRMMAEERMRRPAALRDVLALPADVTFLTHATDFRREMSRFARFGNASLLVRGLVCERLGSDSFRLNLTGPLGNDPGRLTALGQSLLQRFQQDILGHWLEAGWLAVRAGGDALDYLSQLRSAPDEVPLAEVQPAHEIVRLLTSGAMSHGALNAPAHEAVAHGTNMVGGLSNSGEGGEHISRYGTLRASRIKQLASGRFGVWAGYLADPMLEELEIKIGQGAKPGEGGQLPAQKVTVEIAAARGGTPGVELVSPPPHHDTYSIEDLAQLIHDCKAARVRVVVKLVSSEGVGTIAVGVAKAGADVINIAGNTGGTGAAAVTSLKYTGRAAEIGVAEVHQALSANGLRQKVTLRCSGANQTGSDVVKAALLGGDSFEFGTTALMMLKCVMAKNCNIKCPAGLTTNSELFDGDPRALAQYLMNVAHETREVLAGLGLRSLREARGRSDLLHLLDHPASVGRLDLRAMLTVVDEVRIDQPVYMDAEYDADEEWSAAVRTALVDERRESIALGAGRRIGNRDKSVGARLAIDVERWLNHTLPADAVRALPSAHQDDRGRRFLRPGAIVITTTGSAGQSYGAFCNDGMALRHQGVCNDGVGKGASGGVIAIRSPGGGSDEAGGNVLVGNFALFGATGGRTFIEGQAGDRFAVRNSGATAVVEGVGDFACEYMTNGAVLNLGAFGKGFGNGMSGGFVYQYDPYGDLAAKASHDSILLLPVAGDEDDAFHADAVRLLLEWHLEETGSAKAAWLIESWETERQHFVYGLPLALLQYQDSSAILKTKSRKDLLEELSVAVAGSQVRKFKLAYRDQRQILGGAAPAEGETGEEASLTLLNNYAVLAMAQQLALSRLPGVSGPGHPAVASAVRKLLLTEDFALMQKILRHAREALSSYGEEELAALVADKRLSDYKAALAQRNVLSMDSPGVYGWILSQSAKNRAALGRLPDYEELFARAAVRDLATFTGRA
ncbi:glutamate synthase (NADPH/NADH) large chain [Methylopila capsulata]|uniref:Glutamate synthase n=1 Tax=Methylopila capsulata TaxID=61654 RepID=A0A9W6MSB4_9HYPH|nr:glutamate synthase-related protein [Methylopila capsulata]MBM7852411.1 glutamate synthase (NADPH/NADH) large chain [Methylopila capsulata]GLK56620.1 glutamate synthase [Methylopila capsulata]